MQEPSFSQIRPRFFLSRPVSLPSNRQADLNPTRTSRQSHSAVGTHSVKRWRLDAQTILDAVDGPFDFWLDLARRGSPGG
jgi:hypothetical protein